MEIFNKYKNPEKESDKNVSETAENDTETDKNIQENEAVKADEPEVETSKAEIKEDSEVKTEEPDTQTFNTGYAQWVEDDDDEE